MGQGLQFWNSGYILVITLIQGLEMRYTVELRMTFQLDRVEDVSAKSKGRLYLKFRILYTVMLIDRTPHADSQNHARASDLRCLFYTVVLLQFIRITVCTAITAVPDFTLQGKKS
jgi:hypothetical protein